MFNALRKLFVDERTNLLVEAGFLEADLYALTKEGARAMWSILLPKYEAELKALAEKAIEEKKEKHD